MACTGNDPPTHELINYNTRQVTKVPPVALTSAASGSFHHQKAGQSNSRQAKDQAAAAAKVPKQTHADLVAQMRQADEPLSVEGELFVYVSCWSTVQPVTEALDLFSESLRVESWCGGCCVPIEPAIGPRDIAHHIDAVCEVLIGPQGQNHHSNSILQAEFI